MEQSNLQTMIKIAREVKGYSQRELARRIEIHHSTLNDIENGKIKRIDVDILGRIANELDIDIEQLMNAAGYNDFINVINNKSIFSKLKKKSTKEKLVEYQQSQLDLLEDSYEKRKNVAECRTDLFHLMLMLREYDYYKEIYTIDKILEIITNVYDKLEMSAEKYDYSKLPKND